jgi:hypothetical protein
MSNEVTSMSDERTGMSRKPLGFMIFWSLVTNLSPRPL